MVFRKFQYQLRKIWLGSTYSQQIPSLIKPLCTISGYQQIGRGSHSFRQIGGCCKVNLYYIFVTILLRAQEIIFHSKLFLDMLCPVNKGAWLGPTLREKACRSMWAGVWGRSLPEILTI